MFAASSYTGLKKYPSSLIDKRKYIGQQYFVEEMLFIIPVLHCYVI